MLKIKTKDDEIKDLKYKTEKHNHENKMKSHETDKEDDKKKYKSLNKKKILLIITEILLGSGSAITTSILSIPNLSVGIVISSSTAMLTSVAILITNEYFSKLKLRYTKLRDWINVITILYEKTLNQTMVDKKIDEKKAFELKKIFNHYLDKRKKNRSAMSNSAWYDLNKDCTVLKLHDMCHNPKCNCQMQITFTPKQFQLQGGSIKSKLPKTFKGTQTAWKIIS